MDNSLKGYSDISERISILKAFGIIGGATTLAMSLFSIYEKNLYLSLCLLMSSLCFFSPLYLLKKNKIEISGFLILYTLYSLMLYLVATGGNEGSGPAWVFIVPLVTYFIRGLRKGILDLVIFGFLVLISYYMGNLFEIYQYDSPKLLSRMLISFVIVSILGGFYESFRHKYNHKLISLLQENADLASRDHLTGLPNRRYIVEKISSNNNDVKAIALIDIDDFKLINDTFGHQVGDEALIHFSEVFVKTSRTSDLVSRWGGEEFLCILNNTNCSGAEKFLSKLQLELSKSKFNKNGTEIPFTFSAGVVELTTETDFDKAIIEADKKLYKAKSTGKNCIIS
ncbi:GGDEF domain-containing protein [Gilvimarinus chinensis]|uniref:GGDEF domain-containing protein n=1 Tax=Gilvimarinus chinensis TaxID=396005 RepID=UPI000382928B|nr:GGDEF domain-containing protein [Gilvimarinus chinensis]